MSDVDTVELSLGDGAYISQSPQVADKVYKNWFPNYPETSAISGSQAFPTPGLTKLLETGNGQVSRGGDVMAGISYFVNGNILWRVDRTVDQLGVETFNNTDLGFIEGEGRVSIDNSGTQLGIVIPGTSKAYMYSVAAGLQTIDSPSFIPQPKASIVNQIKFVSGYFVFAADNGVVFHSLPNDGLTYNALDFFVYDNAKNDVVGIHEYKDQLYVFSTESGAVYSATNISSLGSAFVAILGYTFSKGLVSKFSIFDFDGSFVMIGRGVNESPRIYLFTGNDFTPISHTSIEFLLRKYTDQEIENSFGLNYTFRGATFAIWNLPNNTFVFDAEATKLAGKKIWHERQSENLNNKERWRVNVLLTAYNRLLVGDSEGGIIGFVDEEAETDYGNKITREIGLSTISNKSKTTFHDFLEVELESGTSKTDEDLKLGMFYSSDARIDVPIRYRSCGKKGEYNRKVRWNSLGQTNRARIYYLTTTAKLTLWKVLVALDV